MSKIPVSQEGKQKKTFTGQEPSVDTFDAIQTRRSIRSFIEKPVEDEKLQRILKAVRMAPSWGNIQCWRLIVIRDSRTRKAISELTGSFDKSFRYVPKTNPAKRGIVEAPVLIAVCADPSQFGPLQSKHYYMVDIGIATQNLMLSARALGLGTVFVGVFDEEKVRRLLNVPSNVRVVGLFPLGYPRKAKDKGPSRKPLQEFVFHEKWGKRLRTDPDSARGAES